MNGELQLSVITPAGVAYSVTCDSVRLNAEDDKNGRNGGSVGIHRGHAHAVIALDTGTVAAMRDGVTVLKIKTKKGFASVGRDKITIVTDEATETD